MKLPANLIFLLALIIGLGAALPQTSSGGSGEDLPCPLVPPCYDATAFASYCANNTESAVETGAKLQYTDTIDCICGTDVLGDQNGGYAALECYTCAKKLDSDVKAWLTQWVYTCVTYLEEDADSALDCWNSGGETCASVSKSKMMTRETKKNKLRF